MRSFFSSSKDQSNLSDLGFGRIVSEQSNGRLINKDGSFNVRHKGLPFFSSLHIYHSLLTMSWSRFLLLATLGFLLINSIFAALYAFLGTDSLFGPSDQPGMHPFIKAFFFSVQTCTTIGYGHIIPHGLVSNILVTLESFMGLLGFAILTGMLFARFSRPVAKIIYSNHAIIAPYDNINAFEFRIVNSKNNQLYNMHAKVTFSIMEDHNDITRRHYYPLQLERDSVPFFPLSWTIVHLIDESSPLNGLTNEAFKKGDVEFMVLLTGTDDTFNQAVHSQSSY